MKYGRHNTCLSQIGMTARVKLVLQSMIHIYYGDGKNLKRREAPIGQNYISLILSLSHVEFLLPLLILQQNWSALFLQGKLLLSLFLLVFWDRDSDKFLDFSLHRALLIVVKVP